MCTYAKLFEIEQIIYIKRDLAWNNLQRLFNTKSIFIQIAVLFQTIQFSVSNQFNCQKQFYFNQFSLFKQF